MCKALVTKSTSSLVHTVGVSAQQRLREGQGAWHSTPAARQAGIYPTEGQSSSTSLFSKELKKPRFKFTLGDGGLSTQGIKSYLRDVSQPGKHSSNENLVPSTDPLLPQADANNREIPSQAVWDKSLQQHGKPLKRRQTRCPDKDRGGPWTCFASFLHEEHLF